MNTLTALSDTELHASLKNLGGRESEIVADIIAHLAEVDKRRLYLTHGFPNLSQYCQTVLACSDDVAGLRVLAARLAARYPMVIAMLREQQLHLTGIRTIAQHLDDANYQARLREACGKTREELQELVAAWAPKPDVPTRIVAVPQTRAPELLMRMEAAPQAPTPVEPQRPAPPPKPIAPDRYTITVTIDRETRDALMRARDHLRHAIPDGDIAKVISRAVTELVDRVEARKFGKKKRQARAAKPAEPKLPLAPSQDGALEPIIEDDIIMPRTPDRATRREVAKRDSYRCCYVSEDGRRCSSTAWLEYDHKLDWSLNGPTTADNLQLLCRPHHRAKHPEPPNALWK